MFFLLIRGFHTSEYPIKQAPMQILMPEMDSTGRYYALCIIIMHCVASQKTEIFISEKPWIILLLLLLLHILLYSRT